MTTEDFYNDETVSLHVNDEFVKVRQQGYSVELGDTISKGWDFMKPHIGSLIGFLIVAFIISIIFGVILTFTVSLVPYVGQYISQIISGAFSSVLMAGFYYYFTKEYKDGYATFSDFFESFQDAATLIVSGLLTSIITYAPLFIVGLVISIFVGAGNYANITDPSEIFQTIFAGGVGIAIFVGGIMSGLIAILYTFTIPIIATNSNMGAWQAMEISRKLVSANYLGVLGFIIILFLLNVVGAMCCLVGLFITGPLTYASTFILYTKLVEKNGAGEFFYGDEKAPLDAI
ncbi:hypothetical protein WAF17_20630 [Bernardetia sp. ABR2-2B]|uniref:hypothetical protein n=1 Tax=Bernardetia sp. ABR2-2B TaxID=3127472 RepID=UPI0030D371C3